MGRSGLLLLLLVVGPQWKKLETVDGIAIFSRELPNERLVELRLTTTAKASVEKLCSAAFASSDDPSVTTRKVLLESANERVVYEQISPPIVSKRDYALRATRHMLPDGRCRLIFAVANELAPPPQGDIVRIEKLRGSWEFEPAGTWTRATYTIFTDPGGSLPAGLVEGGRQQSAVSWVKQVLKRAAN